MRKRADARASEKLGWRRSFPTGFAPAAYFVNGCAVDTSQISAFCALAARSPCICSFANIGVLRADRAQPLYLLTHSGRFAAFGGNSTQG